MKRWKALLIAAALVSGGTCASALVSFAEEGKTIEQLISTAKTAADHEAVAAYYEKEAQEAHTKHEEHLKLKASYEKIPHLASKTNLPWHCNTIAANYQKTANEYEALAKLHHDMAKAAK